MVAKCGYSQSSWGQAVVLGPWQSAFLSTHSLSPCGRTGFFMLSPNSHGAQNTSSCESRPNCHEFSSEPGLLPLVVQCLPVISAPFAGWLTGRIAMPFNRNYPFFPRAMWPCSLTPEDSYIRRLASKAVFWIPQASHVWSIRGPVLELYQFHSCLLLWEERSRLLRLPSLHPTASGRNLASPQQQATGHPCNFTLGKK